MKLLSLLLLTLISFTACEDHERDPASTQQNKQEDTHRVQEPVANGTAK